MTTQHGGGPEARPATWEDGSNASDYDALADLFLSDDSLGANGADACVLADLAPVDDAPNAVRPEEPARSAAAAHTDTFTAAPSVKRHRVEALIFGHLPPMSGAWAAQYAARVAKDSGEAVAFVRLHAGHTTVQVFGAPANARVAPMDDFADAVAAAGRFARRFIVRVDETDEPSLIRWSELNEITLLAGADQAAIVAAYRTIKAIANAIEEQRTDVELRVSFTGVEEDKARAAFAKLERAAAAFLETPLRQLPGVTRMAPAFGPTLHRAETRLDSQEALRIITGVFETDADPAPIDTPRPTPREPARERQNERGAEPTPAETRGAGGRAHETARPEAPAFPLEFAEPTRARRLRGAAPARSRRSNAPRGVDADGSLASRLGSMTTTPFRCPHAPDVEVAVGDDGSLHLLVDQRVRGAVKSLLCARGWATANARLLAAGCRAEGAPPVRGDAPPTLHVFVREATRARALIDTDVRVHLLMRVRDGGREAWACADLN